MMKREARVTRALPWAVTLIGVMGLLASLPASVVGQANSPLSVKQSAEVEELKQLVQQVNQLRAQGQDAAAIPLAERLLVILEKNLGKEHPDVATNLNNLALLYQSQGNYTQAEPLFQRSLAIREKVLGKEHPDVAQSLNNLAELYRLQGNYSQAEPLFQRSLTIFEKALGSEHPFVATNLNNLALLYLFQGNYSQAEPLLQRALSIFEETLGLEHLDVGRSLQNLALLYQAQGNYNQAEPLLQRALSIFEETLGLEHPFVATNLNNLALLYQAQGNYSQAELLLQRALSIGEKTLGSKHSDVAIALHNLAVVYQAQGNYSQAESLLQRALSIFEEALNPEHETVARSLAHLGDLYLFQGNYSQAELLYQRALSIFEKALSPEHPDVAISLHSLVVLYQAQGNITRALEFQNRANNIEERNLTLIFTTGSEAQKSAYIATLWGRTNRTVSLQVQGAPDNPQATRLALTTILRRKGRVLDALSDSLQTLRQNLKPEDQKLLDQLAATRSQLAALLFKGAGNLPPDQYRQQVATLKAQADQLEAILSRRSAFFRTESQPVSIEAVQQLIPADAALVELVLYYPFNVKAKKPNETWGSARYVAYILHSTGDPQWVDLGEAVPINQAVADFRQAILNPIYRAQFKKEVARSLDEKLMQPIRQRLGNTRNILLAPDSQLNLIPFAALVDENNRYLVENYSITYLSSGRDLLRLQNPSPIRSQPIIVANPDYDKPGNPSVQIATNPETSPPAPSSLKLRLQGEGSNIVPPLLRGVRGDRRELAQDNQRSSQLTQLQFGPLPGTAEEAKAITPMLPGVKLLTGSQATENAIKQLQSPTILHIATHGFFLNDVPLVAPPAFGINTLVQERGSLVPELRPGAIPASPTGKSENPLLRSGLALAGFNPRSSGSEDGVLTALEVAGLNLSGTKLVVLSACETGLGDVTNGQGVYGLRRALAIAGTESQLISLWKVDDFGTKDLIVSYYQRLMNNVGRSQALRQTQLEMLNSDTYQHPYYWAAFIPSGDWTPMGNAE